MVLIDENIQVSLLEKLLINWSVIPDAVADAYQTCEKGEYLRTVIKRVGEIWNHKVNMYRKLLTIKQLHNGIGRAGDVCKKTPCGRTRLLMTYLR